MMIIKFLKNKSMKTIAFLIVLSVFTFSCEKLEKDQPDTAFNLSKSTMEMIEADNSFGFSLFKEVVNNEDPGVNIFISPTSVALALAMTYNGAEGETREAMEFALQKKRIKC